MGVGGSFTREKWTFLAINGKKAKILGLDFAETPIALSINVAQKAL